MRSGRLTCSLTDALECGGKSDVRRHHGEQEGVRRFGGAVAGLPRREAGDWLYFGIGRRSTMHLPFQPGARGVVTAHS